MTTKFVVPVEVQHRNNLERCAPHLWAEQERRRLMLERQDVTIAYRRATTLPPTGELKRLILRDGAQADDPSRELRLITENYIKTFRPRGVPYVEWRDNQLKRTIRIMEAGQAWVADVGGGVVLGTLLIEPPSTVHCIYVKPDFRGNGIGLGLLRAAGVVLPLYCPRATASWALWAKKHMIPWEWNGGKYNFEGS